MAKFTTHFDSLHTTNQGVRRGTADALQHRPNVVLKIEEFSDGSRKRLLLSGRIESSDVQQLKAQIDGDEQDVVLDLGQIRIVDLDAVRFLADCESHGIELRDCPPFVRAWILLEQPRAGELK